MSADESASSCGLVDDFGDDLPLAGDYVGLGGPEAVPLETKGPFLAGGSGGPCGDTAAGLLDDLFLKPDNTKIESIRRAHRLRFIAHTKSKLKWNNIFHLILGFVMLAKLFPAILDKLDIFIMEIEELFIPKPDLWEWVWLLSLASTVPAFMASKKSNVTQIRVFQVLIISCGILPLLVGMASHFSDAYAFISADKKTKVLMWMGLPVSMLWYAFIILALQCHGMQMHFSGILVNAWQSSKTKKRL